MKIYPHGDDRRYINNGCRCDTCREAHRIAAAQRRRLIAYGRWDGLIDATGTIRRLRSLCRVGHHAVRVAAELNLDPSWIRALTRGDHPQVYGRTAARIRAVYGRLAYTPAPPGIGTTRVRNAAEQAGWPPPAAWDDDTIDDPNTQPCIAPVLDEPVIDEVAIRYAVHGDQAVIARLNDDERWQAAAILRAKGRGAATVAKLLDLPEGKVRNLPATPTSPGQTQAVAA